MWNLIFGNITSYEEAYSQSEKVMKQCNTTFISIQQFLYTPMPCLWGYMCIIAQSKFVVIKRGVLFPKNILKYHFLFMQGKYDKLGYSK